jgi:hypothetical protein
MQWVSNALWSVFIDEHGQLSPLLSQLRRLSSYHGPTPRRLPVSAVVRTRLPRLRRADPRLLL